MRRAKYATIAVFLTCAVAKQSEKPKEKPIMSILLSLLPIVLLMVLIRKNQL